MQMREPLEHGEPPPILTAPAGIAVETAAIRIPSQKQLTWRIRAERPADGDLRIALPGGEVSKRIVSGAPGLYDIAPRRVRSFADALRHPGESRIPHPAVEWIEVGYPRTDVAWVGFELHWLGWVLLFSIASALLLKRRFKVVF
jgi:hypothetical protein